MKSKVFVGDLLPGDKFCFNNSVLESKFCTYISSYVHNDFDIMSDGTTSLQVLYINEFGKLSLQNWFGIVLKV